MSRTEAVGPVHREKLLIGANSVPGCDRVAGAAAKTLFSFGGTSSSSVRKLSPRPAARCSYQTAASSMSDCASTRTLKASGILWLLAGGARDALGPYPTIPRHGDSQRGTGHALRERPGPTRDRNIARIGGNPVPSYRAPGKGKVEHDRNVPARQDFKVIHQPAVVGNANKKILAGNGISKPK